MLFEENENANGEVANDKEGDLLRRLHELTDELDEHPYSVQLYLAIAETYARLCYPDLAAGAAYKALILLDAVEDESDEYHDSVLSDIKDVSQSEPVEVVESVGKLDDSLSGRLASITLDDGDVEDLDTTSPGMQQTLVDIRQRYQPAVYALLSRSLQHCGCWQSAYRYCTQGLKACPDDKELLSRKTAIHTEVDVHYRKRGSTQADRSPPHAWPDQGMVRRECYPWNDIEPDRFTSDSLDFVNVEMTKVAPLLEVKAVELPSLDANGRPGATSKQLGVFAKADILPGREVLIERSMLTVNNRLNEELCDACSEVLPTDPTASATTACPECETVFCSETCFNEAQISYHPAICDKDIDAIAKDVPPAEAADSLYLLLLQRSLTLAETQDVHPLELKEVKYIWGDYTPTESPTSSRHFLDPNNPTSDPFAGAPRTLPFSFTANIALPFSMLTKMDIDIFAQHRRYDVHIFNTLYAKFRGTASARLSGRETGSIARGPDVAAVHSNWCMANHSCDPNVEWEWGGMVRFCARKERVVWQRTDDEGKVVEERRRVNRAGIRKGEEVLNHYCDVELDVRQRREWAAGALGGNCRCERCVWEAGEQDASI